jgi:phosphate transport system substrate-binding protein
MSSSSSLTKSPVPDGPLAAYGLVSDPELAKTQEMVKNRTPMGALN